MFYLYCSREITVSVIVEADYQEEIGELRGEREMGEGRKSFNAQVHSPNILYCTRKVCWFSFFRYSKMNKTIDD